MAKIDLPYFVAKTMKSGKRRFYWQPSAALARAGWASVPLGTDEAAAIDQCRKINAKVEAWLDDRERPEGVQRRTQPATIGEVIAGYRRDRLPKLAPSSQSTYASALAKIEAWAHDVPVIAITRKRVRVFRDGLLRAHSLTVAHGTLRVLRAMLEWASREDLYEGDNPARGFDLGAPLPRDQVWDYDDIDAFTAAALAIGHPDLAFAVELAEWTGQREADLLKMTESQWRPIMGLDPETERALAGPDGKVMGIFIRQGKTKRWIGVPITGPLRDKIEARIAENRRRAKETGIATTTLLRQDANGEPWKQRWFIRKVAEAREHAVAAGRPQLNDLEFRDLRRTAVVRLGELGLEDHLIAAITGHKLETVKKILEVYLPRTTKMAARAIVARIGAANVSRETAANDGAGE